MWPRLYDSVWFWDRLLHLKGTALVSFVGFLSVYALPADLPMGRVQMRADRWAHSRLPLTETSFAGK